MKTGWLSEGGKWYYLSVPDGRMYTGTRTIEGKQYAFHSSGYLISEGKSGSKKGETRKTFVFYIPEFALASETVQVYYSEDYIEEGVNARFSNRETTILKKGRVTIPLIRKYHL